MRSFKRSQRVADQIKRDVAEIIADRLRDSRALLITVSTVEVTNDLRYAKVYYTVFGEQDNIELARDFFSRMGKTITVDLARRLHIRRMPELTFIYDTSLVEGLRVTSLIDKVASQNTDTDDDDDDDNETDN